MDITVVWNVTPDFLDIFADTSTVILKMESVIPAKR
jgi:hypothetical protein